MDDGGGSLYLMRDGMGLYRFFGILPRGRRDEGC